MGRGKICGSFELLGVGDAAIGESGVVVVREFCAACVVVLTSVGELNTAFGGGGRFCVRVTSIEKGSHGVFLKEIQVPVPWLGVSAPHKGVG